MVQRKSTSSRGARFYNWLPSGLKNKDYTKEPILKHVFSRKKWVREVLYAESIR